MKVEGEYTNRAKVTAYAEALAPPELHKSLRRWRRYKASGDSCDLHKYLASVLRLEGDWRQQGYSRIPAGKLLTQLGLRERVRTPEPFNAILICTCDVDAKCRSKWTRCLRYARAVKEPNESLHSFIKRKGGMNECARLYTRRMNRIVGIH